MIIVAHHFPPCLASGAEISAPCASCATSLTKGGLCRCAQAATGGVRAVASRTLSFVSPVNRQ
jgi:hypothetical protein